MRRILIASMIVLGTLATGSAFAQIRPAPTPAPAPKTTEPKIQYPENEIVDFDVQIIRGHLPMPAGALMDVHRQHEFEAMIPERAHFKAELALSTFDLR